jgi:LacI family transcriptional regulator
MSVTIKQIAKHTGLSIPTVGNVLGRAANRYSAETRKRVLQAAEELGYRPNSSARAMRRGRFGCAALVLSRSRRQTHSHIPAGLLDGLDDALAQYDMHLTVSRLTDEELTSEQFLPKVLRESMADGMIINYTHAIPQRMLDLIHAHHAPAVWLNAKLLEDCVYPDDEAAARTATNHLIALGHRRIALVHFMVSNVFAGPFDLSKGNFHYSVADRARGYASAMLDAGLTPAVKHHDRYVEDTDHLSVCRAMLARDDRPTAVLVYSDRDVPTVVRAASELGLSVPRDLSVLVFHPGELWAGGQYVSTISVPTAEMGRRAVAMLMRKLESPSEACPAEPVLYEPITGQTIRPPTVL